MNYYLLPVGLFMILVGLVLTYFLVTSMVKFTNIAEMQTEAVSNFMEKRNELTVTTLLGVCIMLIGAMIINEARKR